MPCFVTNRRDGAIGSYENGTTFLNLVFDISTLLSLMPSEPLPGGVARRWLLVSRATGPERRRPLAEGISPFPEDKRV